jgi:hypothetical protein
MDWINLGRPKPGVASIGRLVEPDNGRLYMSSVTRYAFEKSTGHRTDGVWGGAKADRILELGF